MAFIRRINYLGSFTTFFILTGISFASIIIFILYVKFADFKQELDGEKALHEYALKKEKMIDFYNQYSNIILSLQNNRFFTNYLETSTKDRKKDLLTLFETIVQHEKYINQLRYIDNDGQEIIRVDRKKLGGKIIVVKDENLQNKRHREYFTDTIKNKPSELYISRFDLNIENKQIEVPYKPVLRLAIPVYHKLEKKGILIVNTLGGEFLNKLIVSNSFNIDIYDQDNYILVSNDDSKNNWTRYLNLENKIDKDEFILKEILIENGKKESIYIGFSPKSWVSSFFELLDVSIISLLFFIICISFVMAYFLSRIPKNLFDELESQQNMLIQQSKVAAMGEMTGMIAHQWRQPLNSISVLLQEIEIKKSIGVLDDKEFENLSSKIKNSIGYMSKTIDNFRDFFKTNKQKNSFNIQELIQGAYNILEVKFKKYEIDFSIKIDKSIKNDKELELYSLEDELKQVLINIINNAIDAHEKSTSKKKYVNIFISYLKSDAVLKVSIEDNAGGIEKSIENKIFEPYSSTKLEQNGTGLGLYMSKMIVERNLKGKITVENITNGTIFSIFIKNLEK